ncbi:MAG: capsular biosynthesis protein [Devosia sp.]
MAQSPQSRRILLLQGPPTAFFSELGRAFADAGAPVHRVVFHSGDQLRAGNNAIPYRGKLEDFDPFLDALMDTHAITDVLYFADRVPYHRIAERVATRRGAIPYAVENGYLRPDWLTLEPGGMGAYSRFPDSPERIAAIAEGAPEVNDDGLYRHSFAKEAYQDVSYHLTRIAGRWRYPHYEADRPNSPVKEYISWLPQLVRRQIAQQRAPRQLRRIVADERPYFLFPMQLQEDYQIRHNSRYQRLADVVHEVFSSFGKDAPEDTRLLVKIHPLDNGLENWQRTLQRAKRDHGLTGRIRLMSAGPLPDMLSRCEGVVLVNSTVGIHAIRAGKPVKALGTAVYNMPGLTDPQPLDGFWTHPQAPDPVFCDQFLRALAKATQVRGSFYHHAGMKVAAKEIARRVLGGLGEKDWFVTPPPRMKKAIQEGVPENPPLTRK